MIASLSQFLGKSATDICGGLAAERSLSAPERSLKGGRSSEGQPQPALGRKAPGDIEPANACDHCSAYSAFRRQQPSVIEASDRVEYAVHLIVRHGFVR
jgi:hypothetical protein